MNNAYTWWTLASAGHMQEWAAYAKSFNLEEIKQLLHRYSQFGPLPGILLPFLEALLPFLPLVVILVGLVALGWMWLRMVKAAQGKLDAGEGNAAFYDAKVKTARFYMAKLLPQTNALFITIMAGAKPLMELEEAAF